MNKKMEPLHVRLQVLHVRLQENDRLKTLYLSNLMCKDVTTIVLHYNKPSYSLNTLVFIRFCLFLGSYHSIDWYWQDVFKTPPLYSFKNMTIYCLWYLCFKNAVAFTCSRRKYDMEQTCDLLFHFQLPLVYFQEMIVIQTTLKKWIRNWKTKHS